MYSMKNILLRTYIAGRTIKGENLETTWFKKPLFEKCNTLKKKDLYLGLSKDILYMNVKKLAIIGAISLVIIGCVIAAGCTSTTTSTSTDHSLDSIAGIWYSEYIGSDGNTVKQTDIVKKDGSVHFLLTYDDGTVSAGDYMVMKKADGTYVANLFGQSYTWNLNAAKDTITSTSGRSKKLMRNTNALNIVGVWVNEEKNYLTSFNADGTGTNYKGKGNTPSKFTWTSTEPGKINIHYVSGIDSNGKSNAGKEYTWTYDSTNKNISTSTGVKLVTPTVSKEGFTIMDTSSSFTSSDSIVGAWFSQYVDTNGDTKKYTIYVSNDGTAYRTLTNADDSVSLFTTTVTKNTDGTYTYKGRDGSDIIWTLANDKKTFNSSTGLTYTKKFTSSDEGKNILSTWVNDERNLITTFNADGTGITYKGKNKVPSKFTWTSTEPGKINLHFLSGIMTNTGENLAGKDYTWTYDSAKKTLTTFNGIKYTRPTVNKDGLTIVDA